MITVIRAKLARATIDRRKKDEKTTEHTAKIVLIGRALSRIKKERKTLRKVKTIYVCNHSHTDIGFTDYQDVAFRQHGELHRARRSI